MTAKRAWIALAASGIFVAVTMAAWALVNDGSGGLRFPSDGSETGEHMVITPVRDAMAFSVLLTREDVQAHAPTLLDKVAEIDATGYDARIDDAGEMQIIQNYLQSKTTEGRDNWRFFALEGKTYYVTAGTAR